MPAVANWPASDPKTMSGATRFGSSTNTQMLSAMSPEAKPERPCAKPPKAAPAATGPERHTDRAGARIQLDIGIHLRIPLGNGSQPAGAPGRFGDSRQSELERQPRQLKTATTLGGQPSHPRSPGRSDTPGRLIIEARRQSVILPHGYTRDVGGIKAPVLRIPLSRS